MCFWEFVVNFGSKNYAYIGGGFVNIVGLVTPGFGNVSLLGIMLKSWILVNTTTFSGFVFGNYGNYW